MAEYSKKNATKIFTIRIIAVACFVSGSDVLEELPSLPREFYRNDPYCQVATSPPTRICFRAGVTPSRIAGFRANRLAQPPSQLMILKFDRESPLRTAQK